MKLFFLIGFLIVLARSASLRMENDARNNNVPNNDARNNSMKNENEKMDEKIWGDEEDRQATKSIQADEAAMKQKDPCEGYIKPCKWYPKDGRGYDTICSMTGCEGKAFGCSSRTFCWSTCSYGSSVGWRWLNIDPSKEHTVPKKNRVYNLDVESKEWMGWLKCKSDRGDATPCEANHEAIGKQIRCYSPDTKGLWPGTSPYYLWEDLPGAETCPGPFCTTETLHSSPVRTGKKPENS